MISSNLRHMEELDFGFIPWQWRQTWLCSATPRPAEAYVGLAGIHSILGFSNIDSADPWGAFAAS